MIMVTMFKDLNNKKKIFFYKKMPRIGDGVVAAPPPPPDIISKPTIIKLKNNRSAPSQGFLAHTVILLSSRI